MKNKNKKNTKNKIITIIIIIIIIIIKIVKKKKHENVFKNWLFPNFLLLPAVPLPPSPARTPPLTKLKRISSSPSDYVVLTFLGEKKNIFLSWTSRRQARVLTSGEWSLSRHVLANHARLFCSERSVKSSSPFSWIWMSSYFVDTANRKN